MMTMPFRLTLLILTVLLVVFGHTYADDDQAEKVTGVHLENLPTPLFYETYIPVVLEFNLPTFNPVDMRMQWPPGHTTHCENSDIYGSSFTQQACPIVFHFNQLITKLSTNMKGWREFESTKIDSPKILFSCDEITSHFSNSQLGNDQATKYLADLRKCPLGINIIERLNLDTFVNINTTDFKIMLFRGKEEYVDRLSTYVNYAAMTNLYTSLQGTELLNFYMHSSRWSNAILQCDSQRIPNSLISKGDFRNVLSQLTEKLSGMKDRYQLVIPITDVSTYYKSKLSDCTFTAKNSLLVRILIPVRKERGDFKLVNLHTIPFVRMYNHGAPMNNVCSIKNVEGKYMTDSSTGLTVKTSCSVKDLCLISDRASRSIVDPCISAILSKEIVSKDIDNYCAMDCSQIRSESFPIFRRLAPDTYIISGASKSKLDIFINCEGKPYKVISTNETGALRITLSCTCKIVYKSEEFHSFQPCGNQLKIKHVVPFAWGANTGLSKQPNFPNAQWKNPENSDVSEFSWLAIQVFILWGVMIALACLLGVLIVKVFRLSYLTRNEINRRDKSASNIYEIPIMLNNENERAK